MLSPLIVLGLITGVPLLLFVLLRIKPLYLFVSIVTGYFWVEFLGDSADLMLGSLVRAENPGVIVRIALLVIPLILTLLLMRKTLSAVSLPFQFMLLVANSLLLTSFLLPLLTPGLQGALYQTQAGNNLRQMHDVAIAGVAGLHLLVMFIMRPKHHDAHSTGKKHK